MDWTIGNYWNLLLILLVLGMGLLMSNFLKWRNRKKELFAEGRFQIDLFQKTPRYVRIIPILYCIGFVFLALSLVDLMKGSEEIKTKQKMNNVIFLFDVSNSMNAEDVEPNRLQEAKNIMLNSLQNMNNDRVGIVVFAGEAASIMPLTTDFSSADQYIEAINTGIVKRQGTDLLLAMQEVVKKFKNIPKGSRQVILISDGEDNENNTEKAIQLAKEEGITVISIGVGTAEGAPIPEYIMGQLMGYKADMNTGETVISSRKEMDLQNIAQQTGGEYLDGNDLKTTINGLEKALKNAASATNHWVKSDNAERYYQYFLAVSLLCFFVIYVFNPKNDLNL